MRGTHSIVGYTNRGPVGKIPLVPKLVNGVRAGAEAFLNPETGTAPACTPLPTACITFDG